MVADGLITAPESRRAPHWLRPDGAAVPIAAGHSTVASGSLVEIDGRRVASFAIGGGPHAGAVGQGEGDVAARVGELAVELGIPLVGRIASSGADVQQGVASLHAWGRIAAALSAASGVVPVVLLVSGPVVSGPALLLGIADQVVLTADAFAFVSGPQIVRAFTGVDVTHDQLGGAAVHERTSGVATAVVRDVDEGADVVRALLAYLPMNHLEDPPRLPTFDPVDRPCGVASSVVPERPTSAYDVRAVVTDVLDHDSFLELRARYAPNLVTGLGRLDGRTVGVVANQPKFRAGTLDIEASRKAARFVQWCDLFNIPIVTFVDTPGFEPGRDLEWRGMIRHGAELVHAYAAATVPRLCVVLRKAYGGAYIVMDSKHLGNDWCLAWPGAEIAVMGAPGAVAILYRRELARAADDTRDGRQRELEAEYTDRFANPYLAAERGFVDDVAPPVETRHRLVAALEVLVTKREHQPTRRHANSPL